MLYLTVERNLYIVNKTQLDDRYNKITTRRIGMKPELFRYTSAVGTGSIRCQHTWCAWRKPSANLPVISHISVSPLISKIVSKQLICIYIYTKHRGGVNDLNPFPIPN